MQSTETIQRREIDIDIKDLLWELIKRWRVYFVMMFLFVAGALLLQFVRTPKAQNVSPFVSVTVEEAKSKLTYDEEESIIGAYIMQKDIDNKSEYLEHSVLMNANPFAVDVVVLKFEVAEDVAGAVKAYVKDGSLGAALAAKGTVDLETAYINELLTIEDTYAGVGEVCINVYYNSAEGAQALADAVAAEVKAYANAHLISQTDSIVVMAELEDAQTAYATDISTNKATLARIKNEMSVNQIVVLNDLVNTARGIETQTTQAATGTAAPAKVKINLEEIIIAAVVGVIVAALYILAAYVLTVRIRTKEEMETLYRVRVLGTADVADDKKKSVFAAIDKFIYRLRYRNSKPSYEQDVEMLVSNIFVSCKNKEVDKVYLSGSQIDHVSSAFLNTVADKLNAKGIRTKVGGNVIYDAQGMIDAAEMGCVVLVEKVRTSLYDEIMTEVKLCRGNGILILGVIVIGEA